MKKRIYGFMLSLASGIAAASTNVEAEEYISKMLLREVPYTVEVLKCSFVVKDAQVYPPGKLTEMFARYLIDAGLIQDKAVADIGCGCFALGIVALKRGAKTAIGTDVSAAAIASAQDNLSLNGLGSAPAKLFCREGVSFLLPEFAQKMDVIVAGVPWDALSAEQYAPIAEGRKSLSRAFYDVDDKLVTELFSYGFELLVEGGRMFVTSSLKALERINVAASRHAALCTIVKEFDLHNDGNLHYIVEVRRAV